MKHLVLSAAFLAAAATAQADGMVSYTSPNSFDDVVFELENAILEEGLVIDHVSHVGEMLERTRADVGSDIVLYPVADVFSFCSASLSRKVMEADPANIMFCPYGIFVAQMPASPDTVTVGYRSFPDGPMKEVEALLDRIAKAAAGVE